MDQAVFAAIEQPGSDLQVTAVADSGRTATLIELLKRLPCPRRVTEEDGQQMILSTIHPARGLEATRIYLLRPDLLPHPRAGTLGQRCL